MSKLSRNGCGWECCPSGFVEHVKHYRYLRECTDIGFIEYWKWELECLIGMHRYKPTKGCKACESNECYQHHYFGEIDDE